MSQLAVKLRRSGSASRPGNGHSPAVSPAIETTEAVPSTAPSEAHAPTQTAQAAAREATTGELYQQFFELINEENALAKSADLRAVVAKLLQSVIKPSE